MTMRAVRVVRHGEPTEAIEVRDDVEVPEPAPGQVRVAVSAASLNFGDVAGVMEAAGEGVEEWVGRRVAGGPDKTALCADLGPGGAR